MKILFYFSFLVILVSSCEKKSNCVPNPKDDCVCITLYDPVCGCNDVTYGNSCNADCAGIGEYTKGECPYDIKPLEGKWNFLGYESEGAKFKSDIKTHMYEMYLTLEKEKDNEGHKLSGKTAVNFFLGNYYISNLNTISTTANISTKIAGSEADLAYEYRFINFLNGTFPYIVDGDYLKIEATYDPGFGPVYLGIMIFKKD